MKWICVNSGASNENFELWKDELKLATVSVSNKTKIARYVSHITKRLFLVEIKGFFQRKAIIKNEYGIKLGSIENIKQGQPSGLFEFDGKKCFYSFDKNNFDNLTVYDSTTRQTLFNCDFNSLKSNLFGSKSLMDTKFPNLLTALCFTAFAKGL